MALLHQAVITKAANISYKTLIPYTKTAIFAVDMAKTALVRITLLLCGVEYFNLLADLTVSKRPGTSYQIEMHVVNHLYLLFSFVKLVET